ncbi:MAG: hypothetical protein Q9218_005878 [Villophora microphyllina]
MAGPKERSKSRSSLRINRKMSTKPVRRKTPSTRRLPQLPLEVIWLIIKGCNRQTLVNWSCTSQSLYDAASDILWNTLRVTADELIDFAARPAPMSNPHYKPIHAGPSSLIRSDRMILFFLANNALRQRRSLRSPGFPSILSRRAKLPGLRVQNLILDFQDGEDPHNWVNGRSELEQLLVAAAKNMPESMPNLRTCSLEGPLHPKSLDLFVPLWKLQGLSVRSEKEYLDRPYDPDLTYASPASQQHQEPSQILNLHRLVSSPQLRDLVIGRLAPSEAKGLAAAVMDLAKLTKLSVSAVPPADTADTRKSYAGTRKDQSPVLAFLETVWGSDASTDGQGHYLSPSLQHLRLTDSYRHGMSRMENLLQDTISPCTNLAALELRLMAIEPMRTFLVQGNFPFLKDFYVGGCGHLLGYEDWLALGLSKPYDVPFPTIERPWDLKGFLFRHRNTLDRFRIGLLGFFCSTEPLSFNRKHLEHLWDPTREWAPDLKQCLYFNDEVWYGFDIWHPRCKYGSIFCFADNEPSPVTMWDLEDSARE